MVPNVRPSCVFSNTPGIPIMIENQNGVGVYDLPLACAAPNNIPRYDTNRMRKLLIKRRSLINSGQEFPSDCDAKWFL